MTINPHTHFQGLFSIFFLAADVPGLGLELLWHGAVGEAEPNRRVALEARPKGELVIGVVGKASSKQARTKFTRKA